VNKSTKRSTAVVVALAIALSQLPAKSAKANPAVLVPAAAELVIIAGIAY
jgi:hypothetical protein